MPSIRFFLLAAIIALTPALAHSQVRLTFAWPDGLQATVTHTKDRVRIGASAAITRSMTTLYDLKALKRPDGLVVSHTNYRLGPTSTPPLLTETERRQVDLSMIASLPTFVIKQSGEFEHIEEVAAYRAALLASLGQSRTTQDNDPNFRQMIDRFVSESFLNMAASTEWNNSVGFWAGATIELGEEYSSEFQGTVPPLFDREIKMLATFRINREVACNRGGQIKKCVEIELRTIADQSELASAVEAFAQTLAPQQVDKAPEVIESMDVEQSLLLLTEPDGLIPHRVSTSKRITIISRVGAGKNTKSEVHDSTAHYAYQ